MTIFSIYMLLLAGMPCGDTDECWDAAKAGTTTNHKDHKQEKDGCTPFCSCACCAAPVPLNQRVAYRMVKPAFPAKKYPVFNISITSSDLSSVWQPPRLS